MPSWRAFRSRLSETRKGDQQSGFTVLVNEQGNANRTDFCLFEARLLVDGSGVCGSGRMCHPWASVQPSAGVRGSLCPQKESGRQLERRSRSEGRVELPPLLLSLGWGSVLAEQPGWLGCDSDMWPRLARSGPKDRPSGQMPEPRVPQ